MIKMFNISKYEDLMKKLVSAGLKPTTNWNEKLTSNSLLLRHDIDFSIEFAHQLALAESRVKICSTFFFMLTSNIYNPLSAHNQKLIKSIADMGHKVSLHFDPTVYESLEYFLYEKNIFENIFNQKIDIVSIHQPGLFLNNNDITLSGTPQTYQDVFFKRMKYISDSNGRDIFPQITKYLEEPRELGLHLLIHPIWWMGIGGNPTETCNALRARILNFNTSYFRTNCLTYTE
tara:strand:+ start:54 stop:749 length:696 start_codon:yes stop_codon:yes gene_type:complete